MTLHIHVTAQQDSKMLNTGDHVEKLQRRYRIRGNHRMMRAIGLITGPLPVGRMSTGTTIPLILRLASIESNVEVHATSKGAPAVFDFTLSVDSLGDEGDGGTVSAEITRKGMRAYEQENLEAGTHSFYRDSNITITAVPNAGYRVRTGPSTARPQRIPQ